MYELENAYIPLCQIAGPALAVGILHLFKTSTGKPWAEVTKIEAMEMVARAKALRDATLDLEIFDGPIQDILDDGFTAEGLLLGYFDAERGSSSCDWPHPGTGCDHE